MAQTPLMDRPPMPVIFFSLKDLKEADEPAFQTKLKLTLSALYNRHNFLADTLSPVDRTYFDSVLNQSMDLVRLIISYSPNDQPLIQFHLRHQCSLR